MNVTLKRILIIALPALGLLAIGWMLSRPSPGSAEHRAALVQKLSDMLPGARFAASADLTVHVGLDGAVYSVDLKALQETCLVQGPQACRLANEALANIVRDAIRGGDRPPIATLRPTLAGFSPQPDFARGVIVQPWVGGLEVRYAFFNGPVAQYLTTALAERLKLDSKALLPMALAQMEASPNPPVLRPVIGMRGVSFMDGEGDPAAEVLSSNRMQRFREKTGLSRALLAFPTRHTLLVANADTASGAADLRGAVQNLTSKPSQHVISTTVFLWDKGQLTALPR